MDVSIAIVNYNTRELALRCIRSIYSHCKGVSFEIILVDNGSSDQTVQAVKKEFPTVVIIGNKTNAYFTKANNQALSQARGTYFLLLNSDTFFVDNALKKMVDFLDSHSSVGACEGLELYENGSILATGSQFSTPLLDFYELSWIGKRFANTSQVSAFRMTQKDRQDTFPIDVGCDAFLLVRKQLMDTLNGYDERFLLYYTENDLCLRIKQAGWEIMHVGNAKIMHTVSVSANRLGWKKNDIYYKDLREYYAKHHHFLQGYLLYLLLKFEEYIFQARDFLKHTYSAPFFLILLFSAFLRFYHIDKTFVFDGEIGDNLLQIKQYLLTHTIPLIGAPTSHPWLSFGPLFYWLYGPILAVSRFNPLSHAYFGAFVSVSILPVHFFFMKKLFGKSAALISSFLIAISPIYLEFSHVARFYGFVPLLIYPFLLTLWGIVYEGKKRYFLAGLLLGIILNFHYSPVILLPFIVILFIINHIRPKVSEVFTFILGVIIPLSTILYYYALTNPRNLLNILLWFPYRILGFFGLYHKNTFSPVVLQENNASFLEFLNKSFFFQPSFLLSCAVILFILFFILMQSTKLLKSKRTDNPILFILLWFATGFVALFIHGSPPLHYYVPLLPVPIILASLFFSSLLKKRTGIVITALFLTLTVYFNTTFLFSKNWFFTQQEKSIHNFYIPYGLQTLTAKVITTDANGKKFMLSRVGEHDQYAENFSQNYQYLLWYYGNEPVKKAAIRYTIYDNPLQKTVIDRSKTYFKISNIIITRQ